MYQTERSGTQGKRGRINKSPSNLSSIILMNHVPLRHLNLSCYWRISMGRHRCSPNCIGRPCAQQGSDLRYTIETTHHNPAGSAESHFDSRSGLNKIHPSKAKVPSSRTESNEVLADTVHEKTTTELPMMALHSAVPIPELNRAVGLYRTDPESTPPSMDTASNRNLHLRLLPPSRQLGRFT